MKYCILKGIEGWGDRLQCLLQAIEYCEKTKRTLIIDWRDTNWQQDRSDHIINYFSIKNINTQSIENFCINEKKIDSIVPDSWRDEIYNSDYQRFIYKKKYHHENQNLKITEICKNQKKDFPENIVVYCGIKARSFKFKYFKYIDFSKEIKDQIEKTMNEYKLMKYQYNCIHLRNRSKHWFGVNLNNKRLKQRIKDKFAYKIDYFEFLQKKHKALNSNLPTIIISDEITQSKIFNKNYYNNELIEIRASEEKAKNLCGTHKILLKDKKQKHIINVQALVDFHLMIYSKNIINDEISLFSNMAKSIKKNDQPSI